MERNRYKWRISTAPRLLDDWTKDVFKTVVEIDQRWIIDMAADRQKQICQSQSLNVFFLLMYQNKNCTQYICWHGKRK